MKAFKSSLFLKLLLATLLAGGLAIQSGFAQSGSAKVLAGITLLLLDDSSETSGDQPVADAGADAAALVGDVVALNGGGSSSPDNKPLTYLWTLVGVPAGSAASLSSTIVVAPQFLIDLPGIYIAQLIVNDGEIDSEPNLVTITTTNRAPVAAAGDDIQALSGDLVRFDGSGSGDPDGDPISYDWQIVSAPDGNSAVLSDTSVVSPTFTPELKGAYIVALVVNDGLEDSIADTVDVDVGIDLTLTIEDVFIGVGRSTTATVMLDQPAPTGGVSLDVSVDAPVVGFASATLAFAEGETEQTLVLTGLEAGESTLRVSGADIDEVSADIEVSQALISLGDVDVIAPSESTSVVISISDPAPAGGVTIILQTLDPAIATVSLNTVFIAEGESTPAANAQVTGVSFGVTSVKAISADFAPDTREVEVALMASFDPAALEVPELQERSIVLRLDAPAPLGGIDFDLALIKQDAADPNVFDVAAQTSIAEGQTQSPPIVVSGLVEGVATLRASAQGFVDQDVVVTVVDAPNIVLRSLNGGSTAREVIVGIDLQVSARIILQTTPLSPVDISITVPEDAGVLLSASSFLPGQTELIFEDVVSTFTPVFYIQGTGLGDNVPVTVEAFEANTTKLAGYESFEQTVDVDPSGVYVSTDNFTTNSFTGTRSILGGTAVLYDDETPARSGERLINQSVRGGLDLEIRMVVDNPDVVALTEGGSGVLTIGNGNQISASIIAEGIATISIVEQPRPGFSLPIDQADTVTITVDAPEAFLRGTGSNSHLQEAIIGIDLQGAFRIGMEASPPVPIDIMVSVGAGDGVLFSSASAVAGSNQLLIEDVTSSISPILYIQGTALGDDVPVTINIFEADTAVPVGFSILASTVDIDPSGVYMTTGDYSTTTFSTDRAAVVTSGNLFDGETLGREGELRSIQAVRGGLDLTVPLQVSDVTVATLPSGATDNLEIAGGASSGRLDVSPVSDGLATVSITAQPSGFSVPAERNDSLVVTVDAPEAFLRSNNSASYLAEAVVGIDLQARYRVGLGVLPPSPVDIKLSVADGAGVLLSNSATTTGETEILIEDVSSTITPFFYIQGTLIGDDVNLEIEVFEANTTNQAGYTSLMSTVDIDPAGVYVSTGDFDITTFSPNRAVQVISSLIWDEESMPSQIGRQRGSQPVRGGLDLSVAMQIDAVNIAALPAGATDTLTIAGGASSGRIDVDPLTVGVATVSITAQPRPNFVLPRNTDNNVVITVDAPGVSLLSGATILIGDELQRSFDVILEVVPPNPVDVSVEIIASAVAVVSQSALVVGTQNVVITDVDETTGGSVFLQGLQLDGATQVRISAPGYQDSVRNLQVVKSGFRLLGSTSDIAVGQTREFQVQGGRLNDNNTFAESQSVRAGASIDVDVSSSMPAVGSVTSPVTMTASSVSQSTTFSALSSGMTEISITQPAGFTAPAGGTELDMEVVP